MSDEWQPIYENYLKTAIISTWKAEEKLGQIGGRARREALLDEMRTDLRAVAEGMMEVWKAHYGNDAPE